MGTFNEGSFSQRSKSIAIKGYLDIAQRNTRSSLKSEPELNTQPCIALRKTPKSCLKTRTTLPAGLQCVFG
jgi:hypothetical protein